MSDGASMKKCDCNHYYLFDHRARCLHQLFQANVIKAVTREKTRYGVEFYIYSDKVKMTRWGWDLGGTRTRLTDMNQIRLALELSEKYKNNVKRVRL